MTTALADIMIALAERLVTLAKQDDEVKGQLRRMAQAFLELTEDRPGHSPVRDLVGPQVGEQVQERGERLDVAPEPVAAEPTVAILLPELTFGRSPPAETPSIVYPGTAPAVDDLALIEARCRLKAEGSRWAATRRRRMDGGSSFYTEIDPVDRDLIARAREFPNCFLWMCHTSGPTPRNVSLYEDVGGCFEAVADAIGLIRQIQDEPEADQTDFETALDLLAEAQSALRVAIVTLDGPTDSDQIAVFQWLRSTATERQIFIQKYMRLDSLADPARWSGILSRLGDIATRVQEARRRRSNRKRLLGKVRHKTSLITNDPDRAAGEWNALIGAVGELLEGGMPPSNRELRELLLPVIDLIPDKQVVPRDFGRVLAEIDRYLATMPPPDTPALVRPTREVREAAELLRGKSLILIGGDRRQGAYHAIKEAFGLSELIWVDTRAHESVEGFAPYVARSEVVVVLLAIRWASHSYGDVKAFCDRHDKPLVRLPAGYNPNQVAVQIMMQASDRLR